MGTRLYIGNLSYSTGQDELESLFAEAGNVKDCQLVLDRFTGKSRGFAFVEMADQESATKAVEMINGRDVDGRSLVVNEARPRTERNDRGDRGDRGGERRQRRF